MGLLAVTMNILTEASKSSMEAPLSASPGYFSHPLSLWIIIRIIYYLCYELHWQISCIYSQSYILRVFPSLHLWPILKEYTSRFPHAFDSLAPHLHRDYSLFDASTYTPSFTLILSSKIISGLCDPLHVLPSYCYFTA